MPQRVPQTIAEFQALDSEDKRKVKVGLLAKHNGEFCRRLSPDIVHDLQMNDQHVEQVKNAAKHDNDMNAVSLMLRRMIRTDKPWWETFEKVLEKEGYHELHLLLNPWEADSRGAAASPSRASRTRGHTGGAAQNATRPYGGSTHLDHTTGIPSHLAHLADWRDLADTLGLDVCYQRTLSSAAESGKGEIHRLLLDHICETLGPGATVARLTSGLLSLGDQGEAVVSSMERSGLIETVDRLDGSDASAAACGEDECCRQGATTGLGSPSPSRLQRFSQPEEQHNKLNIKPGITDGKREQIHMLIAQAPCGRAEGPEEQAARAAADAERQAATRASQLGPFQAANDSENLEGAVAGACATLPEVDGNGEGLNVFESLTENAANESSTSSAPEDDENKISNLDQAELTRDSQENKMSFSDEAMPGDSTAGGEACREYQKPISGLAAATADQERELCKASSKLDVSSTQTGTGDASTRETVWSAGGGTDSASQVLLDQDCKPDCSCPEAEKQQGDTGDDEAKTRIEFCDAVCHLGSSGNDIQKSGDGCGDSSSREAESGKPIGPAGERQEAIVAGTCIPNTSDDFGQSDGRQLEDVTSPGSFVQNRNSSHNLPTTDLSQACGKTTASEPTPQREETQSRFDSSSWPKPWEKEKHETRLMKPREVMPGKEIDDGAASCPTTRALPFKVEHRTPYRSADKTETPLAPDVKSEGPADWYKPSSLSFSHPTPPAHVLFVTDQTSTGERLDVTARIQADMTSGTQADVTSGTQADVTSGTQAGVTSGTQAGVTSGTQAGVTSGTQAGVTSRTQADVTSGTQADVTSGTQEDVTSGTQAEVTSRTQADVTSGTQADVTSGTQADVTSGTQADVTSGTQADVTSGTQANVTSGTQADVTSGTQADVTSGTQEDVTSGTQADVNSGTQAYVTSGTQAYGTFGTQEDVTSGTQADVTAGTQADVTSGTQADVTSRTQADDEEQRMVDVNTAVDFNRQQHHHQPPLPPPEEQKRGLFQGLIAMFLRLAETLKQLE